MADSSATAAADAPRTARDSVRNPYKTILLFGAPGAGKGTQGRILSHVPGFYHFACGDVFRRIDIHSELGRIFYEHSSRGELVPDDVTVRMWAYHIQAHAILGDYKPHADILILDGIPRTLQQAELMAAHIDVLKIVHLVCRDQEAMFQRLRRRALKENRLDDADEKVIRRRWAVYEQETYPVLNCYPKDRIAEVDSMGSPARVLHDVLEVVTPIQDKHFADFMEG